jgi:hypothetical protein
MIFIHLLFWLFIIVLIYILIKYHEYINAIIIFIGALFIEKLHLTHVLLNISTYHVLLNYFYWLFKNNSLVTIVGLFITCSIFSTLMRMLKKWIKIGAFITILYWLGS